MKLTQTTKNTDGEIISSGVLLEGDEQDLHDEVEVIMFQYDIQDDEISGDDMNKTVTNDLIGDSRKGTTTFSIS